LARRTEAAAGASASRSHQVGRGTTAISRPVKNAPAGGSASRRRGTRRDPGPSDSGEGSVIARAGSKPLAETLRGSVHESPVRRKPHGPSQTIKALTKSLINATYRRLLGHRANRAVHLSGCLSTRRVCRHYVGGEETSSLAWNWHHRFANATSETAVSTVSHPPWRRPRWQI
jgi:hypothetical protein